MSEGIELQSLSADKIEGSSAVPSRAAIHLRDVALSWSGKDRPILNGISFDVELGQLAMVVGPVASGKTTLLKGILGEVPHVQGCILAPPGRVSWCEQSPWITVRFLDLSLSCKCPRKDADSPKSESNCPAKHRRLRDARPAAIRPGHQGL
jgi:energy-coupling factor transporter ATP-binding protein EcfA2